MIETPTRYDPVTIRKLPLNKESVSNMVQVSHNSPISQEKIKNLLYTIKKGPLKTLDLLASMYFSCKEVFPRQQYIADSTGYLTRRTSHRHIKDLVALGILITEEQGRHADTGKNKTLIYKLAPCITKKMLEECSELLPSFKKKIHTGFPCSKSVIIDSGRNVTRIDPSLIVNIYKQPINSFAGEKSKKINGVSKNKKINTEIILQIEKRLCLTTHGKIKLSVFPDEALDFALKSLYSSRVVIKNEFRFMLDKANEYCKRLNIQVNWCKYYKFRGFYKIPASDKNFNNQVQVWKEDDPEVTAVVLKLKLTYLEKIKLKAFNSRAIAWALKVLGGTPKVINKFAFLIWAASEYCKQYKIEPFWRKFYALKEDYLHKGVLSDIPC